MTVLEVRSHFPLQGGSHRFLLRALAQNARSPVRLWRVRPGTTAGRRLAFQSRVDWSRIGALLAKGTALEL